MGNLVSIAVDDQMTGCSKIVQQSDFNIGGVPCDDFSPLNILAKSVHARCVRLAAGVSGQGYKKEREFIKARSVVLSLEEQVCEYSVVVCGSRDVHVCVWDGLFV